jgi:hypothetical protein
MKRKFSHTSATWQLFEAFFLNAAGRDNLGQYIKYKCTGKGQAINLAMGLNTCNMQWYEEQQLDKTTNKLSARPMQDEQGDWWLELCESHKYNKQNKRMAEVLQNVLLMQNSGLIIKPRAETLDPNEPGISPGEKIRRLAMQDQEAPGLVPASSQSQILPERGPVSDDLFTKMFDLGEKE